ncbi:sulfite exporter TauE/SafE family protein [Patescibacteria group bacterium]|nr:sulfite exporter TauE/SafE family protein [Patescibacteria group bacterium]MBU1683258.1 sulfite exporter TauE/SafE family protein [Patescibacteria group bacterium]MBU1934979.1 sulfite exporter TauE/SafE family protein [Patescibacteria group bacterium]
MEIAHLLLLAIGVGLGFYVQTVVGFAAALVALPIILNVLQIQEAIALMAIFFLIFAIIFIYKDWKDIDKKIITELGIGMILGSIAGVFILKFGNPIILKKGLGIFILFYVAYTYAKKNKIKCFHKLGVLFGLVGGFFSMLFAAAGPFFAVYINNKSDRSRIIRATLIGVLGINSFVRVLLLVVSDILTVNIVIKSLYILPFFLLSLYLGHKTYHKINEATFKNVLLILLIISGVYLIVR